MGSLCLARPQAHPALRDYTPRILRSAESLPSPGARELLTVAARTCLRALWLCVSLSPLVLQVSRPFGPN